MPLAVYIPSQVGEGYFTDWQAPASGTTDTGKVWVWNNATSKYEPVTSLSNFTLVTPTIASFANATHSHADAAGGGTIAHSVLTGLTTGNPHTQYLLATGGTTGATSSAQTFTNGVITGAIRPSSDSTTAFRVLNAAGSSSLLTVDTTNSRFGIGTTPTSTLHILRPFTGVPSVHIQAWTPWMKMTVERNNNSALALSVFDLNITDTAYSLTTAAGGMGLFGATTADGNPPTVSYVYLGAESTFAYNDNTLRLYPNKNTWLGGKLGIQATSPTAALDVPASTTSVASFRIRSGTAPTSPNDGDVYQDGALTYYGTSATTGSIVNTLRVRRDSSGTPGTSFGNGFTFQMKSSTTAAQDAGRLTYEWVTATHASRASRGKLTAFSTSSEQEAIRWDGDSGGVKLGFYGVTATARQVLATGAGRTVDDVITALQTLGLVKQS